MITPKFYPSIGGIEEQVKLLGKEFLRSGYEVNILTYKKGREKSKEIIFNMNIFTFRGFLEFWQFFRTHTDYERIICRQYYKMSFFLGILKFFSIIKSKTIIVGDGGTTENEITLTQKQLGLFSRLFFYFVGKNDFLVGNNASFVSSLKNTFSQKNIKKIYNGIEGKKKTKKVKKIKNILFLSRFDQGKGHRETIQAFKNINNTQLQLHIIGYGESDEENLVKKLISDDIRITLHGKLYGAEKEKIIEKTDLFVFPTYYAGESFGIVLFEMAQQNIPIITTNFADTKKLFGDNILYIEKQNIEDLQEKMEWIIENIDSFQYDYSEALVKVDIKNIAQKLLAL